MPKMKAGEYMTNVVVNEDHRAALNELSELLKVTQSEAVRMALRAFYKETTGKTISLQRGSPKPLGKDKRKIEFVPNRPMVEEAVQKRELNTLWRTHWVGGTYPPQQESQHG